MSAPQELNGVFRSTNNGTSWTKLDDRLLPRNPVYSFMVSDTNLFIGSDGGVFLSTNNGISWRAVNNGLPASPGVSPLVAIGTNLFAACGLNGVFLSTNNGANWTAVNNGLSSLHVNSLVAKGGNLFVSTNNVSLSTNNDKNWSAVNNGLPIEAGIQRLAFCGPNLFAGCYDNGSSGGVFRSTDNGTNWSAVNNGFASNNREEVSSFAVYGTNIFVGTYYDGIYLSTNNGTNWTSVNDGLSSNDFNLFQLFVSGTILFAANTNNSIWRHQLSEMIDDKQNNLPTNFFLEQNYPNPFNPTTTINYSVPTASHVTIKVYDLLGRQVAILVNDNKPVGNYSIKIDGSKLLSGVYFYRMEAGSFSQTKKLLLLK